MKNKLKKQCNSKGITLIALVITIIVLLILVGVTIATLMGDNGILTKATESKNKQADGTVEEAIALLWNEYQMEIKSSNSEGIKKSTKIASTKIIKIQGEEVNYLAITATSFWDFLLTDKQVINDNGIVNVEKLTGQTLDRGNGTGTSDVYKIEKQESTYVLKYYENETSSETIWQVEEKTELASTREDFFTFDEETGTITGIVENTSKDPNGVGYYYEGSVESIRWGAIKILSEENVIVPSEINGIKVKRIAGGENLDGVFLGASNLKTVTISKGIEEIGSRAFLWCKALTDVKIPSSVKRIENSAFEDCDALKNVTIEKGLEEIGRYAFYGCGVLADVKIPSSVKKIGDDAFSYCSALTSITIPSSVTEIGNDAFDWCNNLKTITIEAGSTLEIPEDKWGAENATIIQQ